MAGIIASMLREPSSDQAPPQSWREGIRELARELLTWPYARTLRLFVQRFREERLGLTAGSLTFTTLISLVPLLTVALALFTAFPMFSSFQSALEKYFLKSLIPDNIARPVLMSLTQFAAKANRLGVVGLIVLAVTALSLMLTIDRTLNQIWRVQRPRPIAQRVLVYWAAMTLGPLLLGGSLTVTSVLITYSRDLVDNMPRGLVVLLNSVDLVVLWGAIAALFHYVPNTDVRWRHALTGAAFVAVAFHLAKQALAWYVKQVPTYSTLYGAFAAVPIFLIWIYVGWSIVLLGAILAANAPALAGGVGAVDARDVAAHERRSAAARAGAPAVAEAGLGRPPGGGGRPARGAVVRAGLDERRAAGTRAAGRAPAWAGGAVGAGRLGTRHAGRADRAAGAGG